ncbi:diacylglycerol kinase [Psittacicella hinzii]|uniref:Diacylglycerol kinase n=1 Tax=Psittacicella hinzii TaxID=2028575 RepID=A0A3A1YVZ0_9GAMM|nr:diacylglycerol kinase [Psittacicella hinzii]RIY40624.1 diacylglycerol kinase [Psittacicella hinzii]
MQKYTGFTHFIKAAGYSWKGLKAAFKNEAAFRQEVVLLIITTPLAIILGDSFLEVALLIAAVLLIIMVELINSAIEAVVDRFGGEIHELSGRAKDLGSAAVLIAAIIAGLIWASILLPKLFS